MQSTLLTGWGYWDVTNYPYGGCFRRGNVDQAVEIVDGGAVKYPAREYRIRFADGRQAIVDKRAVQTVV